MLTMPCGSRAQTSATASPRSTGSPSNRRYDPVASETALTTARECYAPQTITRPLSPGAPRRALLDVVRLRVLVDIPPS